MQAHTHPRGGICLPSPTPGPWWSAPSRALRRSGNHCVRLARRHGARAVRLTVYVLAGALTGTIGFAAGLAPAESAGLGLNTAATAAAFWPPRQDRRVTVRRTGGR
ncbi:hypothetical protein ACFV4Q_21150 [Streptomyces nojiriensis]|uniref:hypothetical protein n=1 Tax=Streptomyces nojiriensis TaxID=66374 RepID=UPI0036484AA2